MSLALALQFDINKYNTDTFDSGSWVVFNHHTSDFQKDGNLRTSFPKHYQKVNFLQILAYKLYNYKFIVGPMMDYKGTGGGIKGR